MHWQKEEKPIIRKTVFDEWWLLAMYL